MCRLLCMLLSFCCASSAYTQNTPPAGPPWFQACKDIDGDTLKRVFRGTSQCPTLYDDFKQILATKSPLEVVAWMDSRKSCLRAYRALFPWLAFMIPSSKLAKIAWIYQIYLTSESMQQTRKM